MRWAFNNILAPDVPRETIEKIETYAAMLVEANEQQNLIASSTVDQLWERHLLDSAQLLPFLSVGSTVDIGSGAGLPGIVLAILSPEPITLVEPRRLRTDFLDRVVAALGLAHVTVARSKAAALSGIFSNITARAVAPATELFATALHLSQPDTRWILPKGRSAQKELDEARRSWQGNFRLEPSRTDASASILVGSGVRPRGGK